MLGGVAPGQVHDPRDPRALGRPDAGRALLGLPLADRGDEEEPVDAVERPGQGVEVVEVREPRVDAPRTEPLGLLRPADDGTDLDTLGVQQLEGLPADVAGDPVMAMVSVTVLLL